MDFVEEELFRATLPIGGFDATFDGQHVFWFERAEGSTVRFLVDGKAGAAFDGLEQWRGPTVDPVAPDTRPRNWIDRITEFEVPMTRSPDGNRFAFVGKRGSSYFVQVDDEELHPSGQRPSQVAVSANGEHLAFMRDAGSDARLVIDGAVVEPPEGCEVFSAPWFEPRGGRYAYVAKRGKEFLVVLDGRPGPEFDLIDWPNARFDPLGRCLYIGERHHRRGLVRKEKVSTLMRDAEALAESEEIRRVAPDPTGRRLAFVTGRGDTVRITVDGREGPDIWNVGGILFSPDGAHLAYDAYRGPREQGPGQGTLYLDGERIGPDFEGMGLDGILFSPDGQHFCAVVQRDGKDVVLVDGEETGTFDLALDPVFADDGRFAFRVGDGERELVIIDGTAGPTFDRVLHLRFGADGGPLTYLAFSGERSHVVVDHEPGPGLDAIRSWTLPEAFQPVDYVLSPDGTHVAYVGSLEGAARPGVDGALGPRYEAVGPPVFTDVSVTFAAERDGMVYRVTASGIDRPA